MNVNEHAKLSCNRLRHKLKLRTVFLLQLGQESILYQLLV